MILGATAILLGALATALPASASASTPYLPTALALDVPDNGSPAQIAYDPTTGTTYVAWDAPSSSGDTPGIDLCVYPAGATTCEGGGPVLLQDTADGLTGDAAPDIAGLVVMKDGEAVVLGSTAQGGVGTLSWASVAGGGGFLSGTNGIQHSGSPISPVSLYYTTGNAIQLSSTDVGLLDDYGDNFSDSQVAGPESPTISASGNANIAGPFPRKALDTAGPEIGAEAAPPPAPAGTEIVVAVGDNYADGGYNPPGCYNYAASGFGVSVGTVNGTSKATGTLNSKGIPNYGVLDCAAEDPVIASGGTDGMGVLEEEGPSLSGQGSDLTMDWRPFVATVTGGSFGAPVELQDLTSHVLVDVDSLSVVDDSGTGVYAMWEDEQGLVVDYSADGGANWDGPVPVPALSNGAAQGNPVIAGVGGGTIELAYDNSISSGDQVYLQTINAIPPTTTATSQTSGISAGAKITIPHGTKGETDKATISGVNAANATGTALYGLFSNKTCSAGSEVFSSPATAVSSGNAGVSDAVTKKLADGTYYWLAAYSGNAGNQASASVCGSEVLTVAPVTPPSSVSSSGTTVTLTITCSAACTVTVTIELPAASVTSVSRKSTKPIKLATGSFKLKGKKGGHDKLTLKWNRYALKLVKKDHHKFTGALVLKSKVGKSRYTTTTSLKVRK
jgi:hypothetical protein